MHCTRYSSWCSLIQGIHARLTGVFICLQYICIVLDIVVDVALYKASMLNWLRVFICLLYICIVLDLALSVVVCKASMLDWLVVSCALYIYIYIYALYYIQQWVLHYTRHLCLIDWGVYLSSIYMHCTRYSSWCSLIQVIYAWLTGRFICLLYICIVLDLAVGVVVCKTFMLNWLEGSSNIYVFALY